MTYKGVLHLSANAGSHDGWLLLCGLKLSVIERTFNYSAWIQVTVKFSLNLMNIFIATLDQRGVMLYWGGQKKKMGEKVIVFLFH